jgi:hypothetical protein
MQTDENPTLADTDKVIAELNAEFYLEYRVEGSLPENEVLEAFGKDNVPFHMWPYWREFIHSMCGRTGLPELVLPMFVYRSSGENNEEENRGADAVKKKKSGRSRRNRSDTSISHAKDPGRSR